MKLRRSHVLRLLGSAPFLTVLAPASAQTPKLRVGYTATDSGIEPYYAQDQGFFSKGGLDVELQPFNNGPAQLEALAGNAIDVGFGDALQIGQAFLRGIPLGVFAGAVVYSSNVPTAVMAVAKDSPIKTAKDLEGQTIGTGALAGTITLATRAWCDASGADYAKIKQFELPFPQLAPAIQRGTVAAALIIEPFLTFAGDGVRSIGKPLDVFGKTYTSQLWATTREFAARNGDALRRLSGAFYETARWANTHQADSLQALAKGAKLDIDRIRNMNRYLWATSFQPGDLQSTLDIALKYKALDRQVTPRDLVINLR